MSTTARRLALDLVEFIHRSPTAFHAVRATSERLEGAGFRRLLEHDDWKLAAGDRRYVVRNDSSVLALVVGDEPPEKAGFRLVGAHTDSPHLKIKPNPDITRHGYLQLGVEPYGGLLLSTWLDRDLTIAGRVAVIDDAHQVHTHLVHFQRALLRIPNLAIHLNREVNKKGLVVNEQQHMVPILGLEGVHTGQQLATMLVAELRKTPGIKPRDLVGFDLSLVDTQPGVLGGLDDSFVFAPRIDNLASCHAVITAMLEALEKSPRTAATRVFVLWDNEECGSRSQQGAHGPFIRHAIERVVEARSGGVRQALPRSLSWSQLISVDMAHAVHPNYADRHDPQHLPIIGKGPVIKLNANQAYASDAVTAGRFEALCRAEGFEPQRFVVRSDMPCGSTIGPITAALMGIATVDVGNPMLSMHSIRETAGGSDHAQMIGVLRRFFAQDVCATRRSRARARRSC